MGEADRPRLLVVLPGDRRDHRVPLTPETAQKFDERGWKVSLPEGAGARLAIPEDRYVSSGCEIVDDEAAAAASARLILCVSTPGSEVLAHIQPGTVLAGFLDPFQDPATIRQFADRGVSALSLELVPRTTIAQSMDALSSQASLAGYAAVTLAASRLAKTLPMMSTPAGTIRPAKMLVVGTGVAGLQAIATGIRLGARVTAYDVRPTAKEQVESLGGRFAIIDIGETEEQKGGYASALTPEQLNRQRLGLVKLCSESDIIVTTAQVFGRRAPVIITEEMVDAMSPGAVIVDAAIATGGNVALSEAGTETTHGGVTVIGDPYLASRVARDASQVLASNLLSLIDRVLDPETRLPKPPESDGITDSVLLTHGGRIRDARIRELADSISGSTDS